MTGTEHPHRGLCYPEGVPHSRGSAPPREQAVDLWVHRAPETSETQIWGPVFTRQSVTFVNWINN